jgi:acyl carrier protein
MTCTDPLVDKQKILAEIAQIIREVVDQPDLQVSMQTTAENVADWDSFNHINIVVAVEERFSVQFHTAEIEELKSVSDLVDLVWKKMNI